MPAAGHIVGGQRLLAHQARCMPAQHEPSRHYPIRKLGFRQGPTGAAAPCPLRARGKEQGILLEKAHYMVPT